MSVYVDEPDKPFGRMMMCHMIADHHDELIDMAKLIGVSIRHIQYEGCYREHFDIAKGKRSMAIQNGAIVVSNREMGRIMRKRASQ